MKLANLVYLLPVALGSLAFTSEAEAQPRQPQRSFAPPPAVSPYLNLVRRGSNPAINYYGIVRPELEFRSNINTLRGAVETNQQSITELRTTTSTDLPITGHAVYFLNGSHPYFGQAGSSGASTRSGGTAKTTRSGTSGAAATSAAAKPASTKSQPTVGGARSSTRSSGTKS